MEYARGHETVLLHQAVDALSVRADGYYVDGTFGRGGHSALILNALGGDGRLLGIDKDPEAVVESRRRFGSDSRFEIAHGSFADLKEVLAQRSIAKIDGLLLDLGVSSPQLDQAQRGFSFLHDGPLDMRMNTDSGESAATWLAREKESEIARVLKEYGEERFARRMAAAVVREREREPITTTARLAKIIAEANPKWEKGKHPATRAFQAIRIRINDELADLESVLDQSLDVLAPGGRLVVISFHSLEDRIVKRFMRRQAKGDELPPGVPVRHEQLNQRLRLIGKAMKPAGEEVDDNVRARSAVMRVAERLP